LLREWQTSGGTYTIDDILSEVRTAEKQGQDVLEILWLLRLKYAPPSELSIFKDATIREGCDVPKFDVMVTQEGKTVALKLLGKSKNTSPQEVIYLLGWISEYDPQRDGPPCEGKIIYLFNNGNGDPRLIEPIVQ
jgi:hypothetical protein